MIQRIQTVYLLLVVAISALMQFQGPALFKGQLQPENGTAYSFELGFTGLIISSGAIEEIPRGNSRYAFALAGLIALVAVFVYRRLSLQLRMASYNVLFILLAVFYIGFDMYRLSSAENSDLSTIRVQWGLILPALMLLFNILAIRGIRKDIELLASADRLR